MHPISQVRNYLSSNLSKRELPSLSKRDQEYQKIYNFAVVVRF